MDIVASQTIYPQFDWYWVVVVVSAIFFGIMLLGFEIFVLPGFGVAGVFGLLLLLGGATASWVILGPAWGALITVSSVAFSVAMFILVLKTSFVKKRLILNTKGVVGGGTESEDLQGLLGLDGVARSDLRPAGIADINNRRIDVVSDGGFIEKGQSLKVSAIDGPRVVVVKTSI